MNVNNVSRPRVKVIFFSGTNIQKRWHNLRSCFGRELRIQKQTKSGQESTKRRKYFYFDRLLFLLPNVEMRPSESNISPVRDQDAEEDNDADGQENVCQSEIRTPKRKKTEKKDTYEEQLLKIMKQKQAETSPDDDTNFALSLVPTLRSLPEDKKLQARIDIMNVLQKLKFPVLHPSFPLQSTPSSSFHHSVFPAPQQYYDQYNPAPVYSNPSPTVHQMNLTPTAQQSSPINTTFPTTSPATSRQTTPHAIVVHRNRNTNFQPITQVITNPSSPRVCADSNVSPASFTSDQSVMSFISQYTNDSTPSDI